MQDEIDSKYYNITYDINIRQQPLQSRMCGIGDKVDRRPIDPPLIVELIPNFPNDHPLATNKIEQTNWWIKECMSNLFLTAVLIPTTLLQEPVDVLLHSRLTVGRTVSSLYHFRDLDNIEKYFFVFSDLSIRAEGYYKFKLCLFNIEGPIIQYKKSMLTDEFKVYPAKKFPGMFGSCPLAKCFAEQGLKIRIRKESRHRKTRYNNNSNNNNNNSITNTNINNSNDLRITLPTQSQSLQQHKLNSNNEEENEEDIEEDIEEDMEEDIEEDIEYQSPPPSSSSNTSVTIPSFSELDLNMNNDISRENKYKKQKQIINNDASNERRYSLPNNYRQNLVNTQHPSVSTSSSTFMPNTINNNNNNNNNNMNSNTLYASSPEIHYPSYNSNHNHPNGSNHLHHPFLPLPQQLPSISSILNTSELNDRPSPSTSSSLLSYAYIDKNMPSHHTHSHLHLQYQQLHPHYQSQQEFKENEIHEQNQMNYSYHDHHNNSNNKHDTTNNNNNDNQYFLDVSSPINNRRFSTGHINHIQQQNNPDTNNTTIPILPPFKEFLLHIEKHPPPA
ncbi:unnamed protein product [Cunninghamella blakesleeana]